MGHSRAEPEAVGVPARKAAVAVAAVPGSGPLPVPAAALSAAAAAAAAQAVLLLPMPAQMHLLASLLLAVPLLFLSARGLQWRQYRHCSELPVVSPVLPAALQLSRQQRQRPTPLHLLLLRKLAQPRRVGCRCLVLGRLDCQQTQRAQQADECPMVPHCQLLGRR